ncbi:hypothetical protein Ocin01_00938 [Orchesella cincta]|uniref:Uncharacterized protein n=1 Tax=Orchesella cincta TaxID=48709 RepID=A0A1D2NKE5_ORCCI|nr:hypothetical protein Ocin01_00938 [Orchesella cincta]
MISDVLESFWLGGELLSSLLCADKVELWIAQLIADWRAETHAWKISSQSAYKTYLFGEMSSKQNRLSHSAIGRTMQILRSSSITVGVSSSLFL